MTTWTIQHVDVAVRRTFEDATALFLRHVPLADPAEIARLKDRADVEAMMKSRAGDLGILVMARLDQGPVVSLLGPRVKLSVYLVGSPLLGARLFARHPSAGLYAPAHVTLYEDPGGVAHFAYDRPSTLLARFADPEVAAAGRAFDEKLATVGQRLVLGPVGGRAES